MEDYEPTMAGRAIEDFVDEQLSNWYVRLCRRRFWKGEYEQDQDQCLPDTLRVFGNCLSINCTDFTIFCGFHVH
jgi:isoleucyl-tRNA synthetase